MNTESIKQFPVKVQEEILGTLKAYNKVNVCFMCGQWHVSTCCFLLKEYPADFKAFGEISAKDVYSEKERVLNYVESFHSYPREYKGKRIPYNKLENLPWETAFKYNANGDIEIAGGAA
nr:MAG TPA: hypothetical protein [Caudoviricetes sp.]